MSYKLIHEKIDSITRIIKNAYGNVIVRYRILNSKGDVDFTIEREHFQSYTIVLNVLDNTMSEYLNNAIDNMKRVRESEKIIKERPKIKLSLREIESLLSYKPFKK